MDQTLINLINLVTSMAPAVWFAHVRQVYISAVADSAWATLFAYFFVKVYGHARRVPDEEVRVLVMAASAMPFIISVTCAMSMIGKFINPDYYAIQLFLQSLGR